MRLYHNNPAFAHCSDFVEGKERILIMMSDVMEKTLDQKVGEQEHLTTFELTDKELERVHGAFFGGFGGFSPFGFGGFSPFGFGGFSPFGFGGFSPFGFGGFSPFGFG